MIRMAVPGGMPYGADWPAADSPTTSYAHQLDARWAEALEPWILDLGVPGQALLAPDPGLSDLEVLGAGLEEAFLALTGNTRPMETEVAA